MVRRLILESLRYWVAHMHVDGFRFDLASVLSRDESGRPLQRPPVLLEIESDPVLAGTKLIAEAWDAAGLYQVGSFVGDAWQEWNGRFRDDVRRFVKSDNDTVVAFGYRCFGSPGSHRAWDRRDHRPLMNGEFGFHLLAPSVLRCAGGAGVPGTAAERLANSHAPDQTGDDLC